MPSLIANTSYCDALVSVQSWWESAGVQALPCDTKQIAVKKAHTPQYKTEVKPHTSFAPHASVSKPSEHVRLKASAPAQDQHRQNRQAICLENAKKLAQKVNNLTDLQKTLHEFDAGEVKDFAQNMVFARGNPQAELMLIGEAPNEQEDREALPFIGSRGQLLDKMLAAISHDESNSYISNVCFWRPPQNREPSKDEIDFCLPFIHRHIALVQPKIVVVLGSVALQALCGQRGIMKNRGQWQTLTIENGERHTLIDVLPLYHPDLLLKRPELKKQTWYDLLTLKNKLEQG